MFLVPMDREGVTVRPIRSMLGRHHLNEVFFDDVEVGPDEVLGDVGDGWSVIRRALAHERVGIARYARCERLLSMVAAEAGGIGNLAARPAIGLGSGPGPGPPGPPAGLSHRRGAGAGRAPGRHRQRRPPRGGAVRPGRGRAAVPGRSRMAASTPVRRRRWRAVEDHWRYAQAATVASGTIEVQRIIVSQALHRSGPMNPHPARRRPEFGEVAAKAFAAAGGVELARRVEADPSLRVAVVAPLLAHSASAISTRRRRPRLAEACAALCRDGRPGRPPVPRRPRAPRPPHPPFSTKSRSIPRALRVEFAGRPRRRLRRLRVADDRRRRPTGDATGVRLGTRLGPFVGDVTSAGPSA